MGAQIGPCTAPGGCHLPTRAPAVFPGSSPLSLARSRGRGAAARGPPRGSECAPP
ncbi:hypothetical protein I79_017265 [Cricetulus griseus]|uniref:Uncharacterized protein n=1 Tax=Cricetulus griseus TaxID=10029 RepID=G3I1K3_CRIGR|nr:hypothetical protein I79_017265 [Cricetulus griseus]